MLQFNSDYILLFEKWDKVKYFINSHFITDYFLTRITEIYNGVEPCRSLKCFKNYSTQAQESKSEVCWRRDGARLRVGVVALELRLDDDGGNLVVALVLGNFH